MVDFAVRLMLDSQPLIRERLARHQRARGQGIGELLLADAIKRVLSVIDKVAAYAIVVDAKDNAAIRFYRTFGFIQFSQTPNRLFMLTQTAAAGLERSA